MLDLFSFHEEGPGFPFFHPKGMVIRNELIDFERELFREYGYEEIMTPIILSKQLWIQSGHWTITGKTCILPKLTVKIMRSSR